MRRSLKKDFPPLFPLATDVCHLTTVYKIGFFNFLTTQSPSLVTLTETQQKVPANPIGLSPGLFGVVDSSSLPHFPSLLLPSTPFPAFPSFLHLMSLLPRVPAWGAHPVPLWSHFTCHLCAGASHSGSEHSLSACWSAL